MVAYHPFDETIWDDPFAAYEQLRDEAPAYYLEEFDCWFISRFEDIWKLETDQRNFTSIHGTTPTHLLTRQTPSAPNLTYYDGREHTKARSYFNPFFLPRQLKALEPRINAWAKDAVDRVIDSGQADAVHELGGRLSVRVASAILGLPEEDADQIMEWVNSFFHREPGTRGSTETGLRAQKELGLYLFKLARTARGRGAPEGTVLHKLLSEELLGEKPDDKAIAIHLNMMVIGGTETFPKVFSACLYQLWRDRTARSRCIADLDLLPHVFQETLRYDMPTQMLGRTITNDFELHGETLKAGSGILFLWGSANRDERVFENPDVWDLDRRAQRILSFGMGQHMCLGAHVARLEGRILLEEILTRMPDYEIDESSVERLQSEFFRGFWRLPLRF
jgi:cytochrome P450